MGYIVSWSRLHGAKDDEYYRELSSMFDGERATWLLAMRLETEFYQWLETHAEEVHALRSSHPPVHQQSEHSLARHLYLTDLEYRKSSVRDPYRISPTHSLSLTLSLAFAFSFAFAVIYTHIDCTEMARRDTCSRDGDTRLLVDLYAQQAVRLLRSVKIA